MKQDKLNKLIAKGRIKAIVKEVAGRRMLFGYERINKRSRKNHIKFLSAPIDLDRITREHNREKPCPPESNTTS